MASARLAARRAFNSARLSAQSSAPRLSARSWNGVVRRHASSEAGAHGAKPSSDMPWMIGSALIFGPAFLYIVSTIKSTPSHGHNDHGHKKAAKPQPMTDDEGTKASGEEIAKSMATAEKDDVPKMDNAEVPKAPEPVTDDEGTKASAEEVSDSVSKASESDAPKADKPDDSSSPTSDEGHPAMPDPSETADKPEQKEKPAGQKSGTFQEKDESGPTNMGKAREAAKSGTPPKEAEQGESKKDEEKEEKESAPSEKKD